MKNIDARKLSSEAQQHNRNQAISLLGKGKSRRDIAEIIGVLTPRNFLLSPDSVRVTAI